MVGNPKGSPVLELTLKGGKYRFESDAIIALTGALLNPKINGLEVEMNRSLKIKKGDELEFGFAKRGARAYLAVRGILNIHKVMGSFSTYNLGNFGGFEGRTLQKGDIVEWKEVESVFKEIEAPKGQIPYFSSKVSLRIMRGLEWEWLDKEAQKKLLSSTFKVSSKSNRMGIRLEGKSLQTPTREMVSSPVIPGIIQLPPNGNPIILMKDGQTIGGYPRIAKVLDEDLWRLGQVKARDTIRFKLIT